MYDFVKTLKEIILGEYSSEFFNKYVDEALKLHGSNLEEFLKIPKMGLELRQALNSIDDAIDTSNQEFRDNLVLLLDRFQTTLVNMEYEARSPYDLAVKHGFVGTEVEWLSNILNSSETAHNIFQDAKTFADFLYKPADFTVIRRLAPSVHTLDYYLKYFDSLKLLMTQKTGTITVDGEIIKTISQSVTDAVRNATLVPSEFANVYCANDYGASTTADYQTNRAAIQAANDAAVAAGGGLVTLNPGTYLAKGIVQDSKVIYNLQGVTLKNPDGLAPDIIRTRITNCACDMTKGSNIVNITSGNVSGIEIGSRVGVLGGGGILDSQVSKLATAIDATSTTITLANANGLTTLAPLLIGDELISFTGVTGNTITGVTRGVFGTTAVPHTTSEDIGVARYLTATVIAKDGNSITLDKPTLKTATGTRLVYGVIDSGVIGFPTLDGNKPVGGAPSSVYGLLVQTGSRGVYDLSIKNTDIGAIMFSNGSAYNYGHRIFMHDCGVPDGGRGGGFWLYQGADNNHFNHIEVTGESWVAVYLDDRTSSSDPWNAPNNNNTFVTVNIDVTKSTTAPLNIVSGQYNRFLGGSIKAPRVGINISDNSQGVGGGAKSIGNHFDNFSIDVSEYPYLIYSTGNTLSNINVLRGRLAPVVAAGTHLSAISPALGVPPITKKGYRKNNFTHTKLEDWTGMFLDPMYVTPVTTTEEVPGEDGGEPTTVTELVPRVLDLSSTVIMFNPLIYNKDLIPAGANETWAVAMDVTVPTGKPSVQVRLSVVAYTSLETGTLLPKGTSSSATYTIAPGATVRLMSFMAATPEGTDGLRFQIQCMDPTASAGRRIILNPLITVEKDTISVDSLFDGDTEGAIWTGEEAASASLLF